MDSLKETVWIIGDVHGSYDKLLALIKKLPKDAHICFVGDLIDRGKRSAYVVDFVMHGGYDCVLGNHETFMVKNYDLWKKNYGSKTLKSYYGLGFDRRPRHFQWLRKLPYFRYYEFKGHKPLVVSHSYIHNIWQGKEFAYTEKELDDMTWQHMTEPRQFNKSKEINNSIFNIFGHTVLDEVKITDSYAMIDTGACFQDGKLSAICYPTMEIAEL